METGKLVAPALTAPAQQGRRLYYLDNLKVALIVLVVLHHAAQPFGPTDWWYVPGSERASVLDSFTVLNGSFFMALFFAISAYLVPAAYDRKGARAFVVGRLKRLGLPFVVGALTVVPLLMYVYYNVGRDYPAISFPDYYVNIFLGFGEKPAGWTGPTWPDLQFGHLWFIQHLLLYCLLYAGWRVLSKRVRGQRRAPVERRPPSNWAVLALVVFVGLLTAVIRVFYPVDEWEAVLDFIQIEIADIGQYATLFVIGLIAYRRGWLASFPARSGYLWLSIGAVLAAVYYIGQDWLDPYFAGGGANLRQLAWSGYESALCVSLCVGLTVLFREKLSGASRFMRLLAADSFTVYIIHVPIVVLLQLVLRETNAPALAAFAVVGAGGVVASFAIGHYLRKLPALRGLL
ncbi:acyltransferase family protein [Actinopolymorpha alba]|uniref:acyltransferase family protein n=1 Tax=Actinopolymorpha alba TaxID=533267 RepID=UPI00036D201C|nr:acyltransferase [Actinopolymorpha alba]